MFERHSPVRKVSFGVGVERTFPVHSPIIDHIEVDRRGDVRRAKLYYLRGLRGKAAKIKESATPADRVPAVSFRRSAKATPRRAMEATDSAPEVAHDEAVSEESGSAELTFGQHVIAFFKELAGVVVAAILVSSLLRGFVGQMFLIPSESMEDTPPCQRPGPGREAELTETRSDRRVPRSWWLADGDQHAGPRSHRQGLPIHRRASRHQYRASDQAGHRPAGRPRGVLR